VGISFSVGEWSDVLSKNAIFVRCYIAANPRAFNRTEFLGALISWWKDRFW